MVMRRGKTKAGFRPSFFRLVLSFLIIAVALLHVAGIYRLPFVERFENHLYDTRLRLTMPGNQDPRVVIVDIDEKSLKAEGHWPWRRDRLARLVDILFEHYQIGILGFDVVFAEEDHSSGLELLDGLATHELAENQAFVETLDRIRPSLQTDRRFAESLRNRPVVLAYYFRTAQSSPKNGNPSNIGILPPPVLDLTARRARRMPFVEAVGFGGNLPVIQECAVGAGYFDNPVVDRDGMHRRVALVQAYQGDLYECLPLAIARALFGSPPVDLGMVTAKAGGGEPMLEWLDVGGMKIPVDERGSVLIPYRGEQGSFPYVSAVDVLTKRVVLERLAGAIVLVGTTAPGLQDLRSTPVQNVYPGVEIHANLISGFLDQSIKHEPGYTKGVEFVQLLLVGCLLAFLLPHFSALWSLTATIIIVGLVLGLNVYAWEESNIVLPLGATVLLVLALFVVHMSYGFFVEGRTRRRLARLFGQYVPPELVDEMSAKPSDFGLAGDSREMTVLFSDVRNFTTISEGLPPHELTRLMNEILTPLTRIIHTHRGTIDKYIGDAVMAFWGAPLSDPEHERRALRAALDMIAALPKIQEGFQARGWPEIRMGVGVHSGVMNVGNMGSEFRMAYTVIGDAVNLGSRLEGLTRQYGVSIIVSESVREKVPDYFFRELDRVRVKGKDEPVTLFEPLGSEAEIADGVKTELALYHEALDFYRRRAWEQAQVRFQDLHEAKPAERLYKIYMERIVHFRNHPPDSRWDGIYVHTSK